MAAKNRPRAVPARANLVLFDDLRRYFSMKSASRARRPVPRIKCYICQDETSEIAHPALATLTANANTAASSSSSSAPQAAAETEPPSAATGIVLPCGHMFHAACWEPYPATAGFPLLNPRDESPPLFCPHCRLNLMFDSFPEFCVEPAHIYDIPTRTIAHIKTRIPQTTGEWRKEYLARQQQQQQQQQHVEEGEQPEERFTLGEFCNGCRLDRAEALATFVHDIREKQPWDCARERLTQMLSMTYYDDEIDWAYPGWAGSGQDVRMVREEADWGREGGFVMRNFRRALRAEGYTWKGERPPPEQQQVVQPQPQPPPPPPGGNDDDDDE